MNLPAFRNYFNSRKKSSRVISEPLRLQFSHRNSSMREKNPKLRRTTAILSGDRRRPQHPASSSPRRPTFLPLRRPKRLRSLRILSRSASDPILLTFAGEIEGGGSFDSMILLPCLNTCTDLISPSRWLKTSAAMYASMEEVKVIVSVAVEGSPGPVRAMVRLGASVEEAIGVVLRQYGSEGRSPRLDLQAAASFQLHHSHFTLQSLKKSDKIGEVGGRSFYLRTNSSRYGPNSGTETSDDGLYTELLNGINRRPSKEQNSSGTFSSHRFLTAIALKINAIERQTKRICRMMACFLCV